MMNALHPDRVELEAADGRDGLECVVNENRVLVPLDDVQRVVEIDVDMPPPLASSWVSGLGLLDGRIALAVSLFAQPRRSERRKVTAIELRATTPGGLRWVIEVQKVLATMRAGAGASADRESAGHRWLRPAVGEDDRQRSWVDVAAMRAELFHLGGERS